MMRKIAVAVMVGSVAVVAVQAAPPYDLGGMQGARASSGEQELNRRGYDFVRAEPGRDSTFGYWWNQSRQQCVRVETYNGSFDALELMPESSCQGGGSSFGSGGSNPANDPNMPPGSWVQTCTNARIDGNVLGATCRISKSKSSYSQINVRQCKGSARIANIQGQLTCEAGQDNRAMPEGSWAQSCSQPWWDGDVFHATCKTRGRTLQSELKPKECSSGRLANMGGQLVCE